MQAIIQGIPGLVTAALAMVTLLAVWRLAPQVPGLKLWLISTQLILVGRLILLGALDAASSPVALASGALLALGALTTLAGVEAHCGRPAFGPVVEGAALFSLALVLISIPLPMQMRFLVTSPVFMVVYVLVGYRLGHAESGSAAFIHAVVRWSWYGVAAVSAVWAAAAIGIATEVWNDRPAQNLLLGLREGAPVMWSAAMAGLGLLAVLHLAREREAARADAERANDMKARFLANMSHELRTPLSAVIGYADLLKASRDADVKATAETIESAGRHLLRLLNDILDISRITAGRMTILREEVDLERCVRGAAALVPDNARIRLPPPSNEMPLVLADPLRLRQAVINLLANATKFSPPETVVAVGIMVGPHGVAVTITDQGPGMAPDQLAVALEPFGQVDDLYARRHDGVGLGLPLAKQLVELQGGTLHIDTAPGRGTTVTIALERAPKA